MSADTCSTCAHWRRQAPTIATAIRRASPAPDVGTCQLIAPGVFMQAGIPVTLWPETHADRTCGDWMVSGPFDPNGGEEMNNIVPLRGAA